jgi:hypothetical protein
VFEEGSKVVDIAGSGASRVEDGCLSLRPSTPRERKLYDMKHLKIAGLCLVSVIMMSTALAGTAAAAPLWLVCLEGTNLTKYSNNQCTTAEAGGKWQSQGLTTTDRATITAFTLTLTDTKTSLGNTPVRCDSGGESTGTVGPGAVDVVVTAKVKNAPENCRGLEGGCESNKIEKVEGANLPWQDTLFETEKKILSKIEPDGGGGEPGWAVTCKTILGSKTDTCTSEKEKEEAVHLENKLTGTVLLVLGTFIKGVKAKCTEGGAKSGEVEGQFAILLASGNGLSVNPN